MSGLGFGVAACAAVIALAGTGCSQEAARAPGATHQARSQAAELRESSPQPAVQVRRRHSTAARPSHRVAHARARHGRGATRDPKLPELRAASGHPRPATKSFFAAVADGHAQRACDLLDGRGVARVAEIVQNADYPLRPHRTCKEAIRAMKVAIGRRFVRALFQTAFQRLRHVTGKVARATFYIPGVTIPQRIVLRLTPEGWRLTHVPGAWAERPIEDAGEYQPPSH